nr:hypothetical protein [Tanacetum cinerariifolium]
ALQVTGTGRGLFLVVWSSVSTFLGLITYPVTILTLDSTRTYVMQVILVVIVVVKVVIAISESSGDIVDLIGDEDPTDEDGDIEVSVSLGEISLEGKKS